MCKVSVIMPVYNKEKYVERAIQSVLNQTYKMLELIIINDGSTDNSLIKCKRFEDERIIIIDSENYGVSHARNLGIARATGTFITFLDADDYLDVYYLEQLLDEKSQMVISGLCAVQENLVIIEKCVPDREGIVWLKEILPSFYQEQYKTGIYGFVAGKLIKTSIIQENKIYFNENIRLAEDYDFFLRVYQNIDKLCFKKVSKYYYFHENSDEFNIKIRDIISQIQIQIKAREFLENNSSFSEKDSYVMKKKVTDLIYMYTIYDESNSYHEFLHYIEPIKQFRNIIIKNGSLYKDVLLFFIKKDKSIIVYLLLYIRQKLKRIR